MNDTELPSVERGSWRSATITMLHAIAFDIELCDHAFVQSSNFFKIFSELLCDLDPDISLLSWTLLEIILPRCVGK